MTDPVRCNPDHLPVRSENLDPDWIVTLAAGLARVEDRCDPVQAPGPSYEEVKLAQGHDVTGPVEALVRKFDGAAPNQWMSAVLLLAGVAKPGAGAALLVERVLDAIWSDNSAGGHELARARVRDAKVAAVLSLGASALEPSFLAAELRERTRSLGEAALVLARIDAQPGLREAVSAEIRSAIEQGRMFVADEHLRSQAGIDEFIRTATGLGERARRGETLTPREQRMLELVERLGTDTAFRVGVEAALAARSEIR